MVIPLALALVSVSGSSAASSAVLLADGAADAGGTALYATLGGIVVALITAVGGVLAVRAGRADTANRPGGEAVVTLLADAYLRIDSLHVRLDEQGELVRVWRDRAERAGWKPQ